MQLIVLDGAASQDRFDVRGPSAVIGRAPDCDVVLLDQEASRHHARISFVDGRYLIEDLQAANPTILNDRLLTETRPLHNGDLIIVGSVLLQVMAAPEAAPAPPPRPRPAPARPADPPERAPRAPDDRPGPKPPVVDEPDPPTDPGGRSARDRGADGAGRPPAPPGRAIAGAPSTAFPARPPSAGERSAPARIAAEAARPVPQPPAAPVRPLRGEPTAADPADQIRAVAARLSTAQRRLEQATAQLRGSAPADSGRHARAGQARARLDAVLATHGALGGNAELRRLGQILAGLQDNQTDFRELRALAREVGPLAGAARLVQESLGLCRELHEAIRGDAGHSPGP